MVKGGDWVSDEPGNPTVFGSEMTYVSKDFSISLMDGVPLKSNAIEVVKLNIQDRQESSVPGKDTDEWR